MRENTSHKLSAISHQTGNNAKHKWTTVNHCDAKVRIFTEIRKRLQIKCSRQRAIIFAARAIGIHQRQRIGHDRLRIAHKGKQRALGLFTRHGAHIRSATQVQSLERTFRHEFIHLPCGNDNRELTLGSEQRINARYQLSKGQSRGITCPAASFVGRQGILRKKGRVADDGVKRNSRSPFAHVSHSHRYAVGKGTG